MPVLPKPPAPPPSSAATPAPVESPPAPVAGDAQPTSLVVTTLSRGKGVPVDTRAVYKQIRAVLERWQATAAVTTLQANRIGLEGETRLCAEFRNRDDAQAAFAEIRKLSAGIDLLNVVEEPCSTRKDYKP